MGKSRQAGGVPLTRRDVVEVLEHTYGPGLIALVFAWAIGTDPAIEVLLTMAADLKELAESAKVSKDYFSFYYYFTIPLAAPFATFAAARWALRACGREQNPAAGFIAHLFLIIAGASFFWAFWLAVEIPDVCLGGRNGALDCEWSVRIFGVAATFAPVTCYILVYGEKTSLRNVWPTKGQVMCISLLYFLKFLVIVIFVFGLFFPVGLNELGLGPIGVSSLALGLYAYALAGLTIMSSLWIPGRFPLTLVLLWLIVAWNYPSAAFILFVLVLAVACIIWPSLPSLVAVRWRWFTAAMLAVLLPLGASWIDRTCGTLPGCNLVQGVAPSAVIASPDAAFKDWAGARQSEIRIVAAQGGGLYAAYHTAYLLAAMADTDPGFADSLFAASGVSGGSIGLGIYWAIRQSGLCNRGNAASRCHRDAVRAILRADYLTPLLGSMYFRDNLDNLAPVSAFWSEPIDRGRVLENLLNDAVNTWIDAQPETFGVANDALETSLTGSWAPDAGQPLLLFNATQVDNGARVLLSPLETLRADAAVPARIPLANGNDMTVANAMVASARFPFVTPPLRVPVVGDGRTVTLQLADGGYFDNSGIETVFDLISGNPALRSAPIKVILLQVEEPQRPPELHDTIGAPVAAFTGAWRSRRLLTEARFRHYLAIELPQHVEICTSVMPPGETRANNFTVSWYLSATTFNFIESRIDGTADLSLQCG